MAGDPVTEGRGGRAGDEQQVAQRTALGPLSPLGPYRASSRFLSGKLSHCRVVGPMGSRMVSSSPHRAPRNSRGCGWRDACGRSRSPRGRCKQAVFAQRAAQSDGDSMETQGLRGSIRSSCRGTAPGSCLRRSRPRPRPRPRPRRDLGVPSAPRVIPDAPHLGYGVRAHTRQKTPGPPRPHLSSLSPSGAAHTSAQRVPTRGGQALRLSQQTCEAGRFGGGWPGGLREHPALARLESSQSPESRVRRAGR